MASSYLSLINWSDQGIRNVKDSAQRFDAFKDAVTAAGGRVIFLYMTLGEYDLAALTELPDDSAAARLLLSVSALGNIRTTTLRAFTEAEFRGIIDSLP